MDTVRSLIPAKTAAFISMLWSAESIVFCCMGPIHWPHDPDASVTETAFIDVVVDNSVVMSEVDAA